MYLFYPSVFILTIYLLILIVFYIRLIVLKFIPFFAKIICGFLLLLAVLIYYNAIESILNNIK